MTEAEVISNTKIPNTRSSIMTELLQLGLREGDTIMVHSSMKSIGWIAGGPVAVIQALMDVLTAEGTLIMPAHSGDYSDPANWQNPPVPESWVSIIRDEIPAFDPAITPTRGMGAIAEAFRKFPKVVRSYHPSSSFAAWGKHAPKIIRNHDLRYSLGENSPLGRLYELKGKILLIGVQYDRNTSLHLAEYRADYAGKTTEKQGGAVFENGQRVWKNWEDIALDADDFKQIGEEFEKDYSNYLSFMRGKVGNADCRLIDQKIVVDYAVKWMEKNRG